MELSLCCSALCSYLKTHVYAASWVSRENHLPLVMSFFCGPRMLPLSTRIVSEKAVANSVLNDMYCHARIMGL